MSDHLTDLLEIAAVGIVEGCEFLAVDVEHGDDVSIFIEYRHDNL